MRRSLSVLSALALAASGLAATAATAAPPSNPGTDRAAEVAAHWTAERMAAAQPRDLVLDERGLAYLRSRDGSLRPYGHGTPAAPTQLRAETTSRPVEQGKPAGGGGGDSTKPSVTDRSPADGASTGTSVTFAAKVTDSSGVRSVSVVVTYPNSTRTSSFTAGRNGDIWSVTVSGFSAGTWKWHVVAKDASKAANTETTAKFSFLVGSAPIADGVVTNAHWTDSTAPVKKAAGRIFFEMPGSTPGSWAGYVCSGTAVTDSGSNAQSVVLTAAHCVYDDVAKVFARNVIFIPSQDDGGTDRTDRDCNNDLMGCWTASYGVVDTDWTTRKFPDNVEWDYAYYVVPTAGYHSGKVAPESLELAAGTLTPQFTAPATGSGNSTTALGYSYSDDPNFMYCSEDMSNLDAANWWLASCGLSGGASGGPWLQPLSGGAGPIISVNSWGYTNQPGMAGPKLNGTSAEFLFTTAVTGPPSLTDSSRGRIVH